MKVIAVVGEEPLQRALTTKIHARVRLAHIARIQLEPKGRRRWLQSLASVTLGRGLRGAWAALQRHYEERFLGWPAVETSIHRSANAEALAALVERQKPDLIVISGTDLLKRSTLERFGAKAMNLHTGISPYIRGGPNCTNWALALGEFDLIGNTIMWIDAGIDTGAIIATERTRLTGRESLAELHLKVMEHAHDLSLRTVQAFAQGKELRGVPQASIAEGRLFLSRKWNGRAMARAAFNHRFLYGPFQPRPEIRLIPLD